MSRHKNTLKIAIAGLMFMSQEAVAFDYLIKLDSLDPSPTVIVKQPSLEDYVAALAVTKTALVSH